MKFLRNSEFLRMFCSLKAQALLYVCKCCMISPFSRCSQYRTVQFTVHSTEQNVRPISSWLRAWTPRTRRGTKPEPSHDRPAAYSLVTNNQQHAAKDALCGHNSLLLLAVDRRCGTTTTTAGRQRRWRRR